MLHAAKRNPDELDVLPERCPQGIAAGSEFSLPLRCLYHRTTGFSLLACQTLRSMMMSAWRVHSFTKHVVGDSLVFELIHDVNRCKLRQYPRFCLLATHFLSLKGSYLEKEYILVRFMKTCKNLLGKLRVCIVIDFL